jgi:Sulfotransferase family
MMLFGSRKYFDMLREVKVSLNAAVAALRSETSKQARRQLAIKEAQIAALRRELARVRGDRCPQRPVVEDTPVFFILGQQKSGTTWLMQILDSHPEILCRGEGRFFGADWRQESVKHIDSKRPPSSLYNAMLDAEYLKLWVERSVWSRNDDGDEHLANLTRMAIDYFLMGELSKTSKRIVGDKSPLLTPETTKEIARIYPDAKIIHIIRDGRDAAVSAVHHSWNFGKIRKGGEASAKRTTHRKRDPHEMRNMGESIFAEGQLRKFAAEWSARVSTTVEDGPALLDNGYVEVRYEDLLERPEEEVRRLLEFLRAEASEKTVKMCVNAASFEKLSKGRTRGQEDPTSFFRKGIAGDWRNVFTEQDKDLFKKEAGDLLIRLGYEKDDSW